MDDCPIKPETPCGQLGDFLNIMLSGGGEEWLRAGGNVSSPSSSSMVVIIIVVSASGILGGRQLRFTRMWVNFVSSGFRFAARVGLPQLYACYAIALRDKIGKIIVTYDIQTVGCLQYF